MGYEIPDQFGNIVFRHTITGDAEEMVCNLGLDLGATAATTQTIVDDVFDVWAAEMMSSAPNTVTFVGATLYRRDGPGDLQVADSTSTPVVGTSSGSSIPPNTALILKKSTALGGRAHRGRMFFPGASEGLISPAGIVDSALITETNGNLVSFLAALAAIGPNDYVPVLLHTTGSILPPNPITSMVCDAKVGSQRRRLRP